jgi:long-chain acyl-CoA synthetase
VNLANIINWGATYFPEREALVFEDKAFTYKELNACIHCVASHLRGRGISRGDRVALYAENRPEWIMIYYGVVALGAAVVCLSAAYKSYELEHRINDSEPVLIVTTEAHFSHIPLREELPHLDDVLVIEKDDTLSSLCETKGAGAEPVQIVDRDPGDTCAILYTGGTTGTPKGAMLTHQNLLYTAQNVCFHERMVPADRNLCFMPLNHVFASNHIMNSGLYAGATLVLHQGFDMDKIVSSIPANEVTRLYAVPTVYIRLLNHHDCHKHLRSIEYSFSAAAGMPSEIVRQWRDTFGLPMHEAYGMTETSSLVTFNHLYRHKMGSVGTPAGVVEVKIVHEAGVEVPRGEKGEIMIRGPNVMKGYYNSPDETAKAIKEDGWLRSGDVGFLDEEGYLFIVDRMKDVIISGGLNVYPKEVEEVLYTHEVIEECSVVGIPHEEYGEAVTAFIKLRENKTASKDELIRFCKEKMASYKAPKRIIVMEALPKTPQGKILKRELRKIRPI